MLTAYVEESQTKKSLTIELPAEVVKRAADATARNLAKQVRLPGFRPGKVPVEVIKRKFLEEIKSEVVEALVNDAVRESLVEKKLIPLGQPKVTDLKFEMDQPLSFKVDIEVRPEVAPKDYKGLKVPSEPTAPSDAEVEALIARLREQHATYDPIEDRPASDGDFALVDIHGSFPQGDGKDFDAEKAMIEIGGAETMPEMTANLRNAEVGMATTFQKDFPADLPDAEFAGKTVLYNVSLVALKKRVLPEMDDDFARLAMTPREGDPPADASVELLQKRVTESIQREKAQALEEKKRRALLEGLLALNGDVEAPGVMIEAEIDSQLKEYARMLARQGVNLKEAQLDWQGLRGEARPSAERRVKEYLLLDAIGDAESLSVTDTELDAELKRRAASMGSSFSEVKSALVKNERLESVREELRIEKVLSFLLSQAITA